MELTSEQIESIVADSTKQLTAKLSEKLSQDLAYHIDNTARGLIVNHATDWITENVLPDVTALLTSRKSDLVNMASSFAEEASKEISNAMTQSLREKLSKSWERKKLFEALF